MKFHHYKHWFAGILLVWATALPPMVHAQVNSWSNTGSGTWKWETGSNWLLSVPPSISQSAIFITNAASAPVFDHFRTVEIDATTVASAPGSMMISNLTLSGVVIGPVSLNTFNTLFLNNAGTVTPLRIYHNLRISTDGSVSITNSVLRVDGLNSGFVSDDGNVTLNTGSLITTSAFDFVIGDGGNGQLTVSAGTWLGSAVVLGNGIGSSGALSIGGGTVTLSSSLLIGGSGVGSILLAGGQLNTSNDTYVGEDNVGQVTVSNGTWVAGNVYLGLIASSQGTVTIAGGTNSPMFSLEIGYGTGTTGAVWLTGGLLNATNETSIGWSGVGQMTVSNGIWKANNVYVGNQFSSLGTLTVTGGTNNLLSTLQIAYEGFTTGMVWMTGGQLTVTGATIIGENGVAQMTVSNGTWLTGSAGVGNGLGSSGTLTIVGGSSTLSSSLEIAHSSGTKGAVWLTGGQLRVTNVTSVGQNGTGQMTVSNGTWTAGEVDISENFSSSQGTLTIAGGTNTFSSLGVSVNGTGTVWLTGGQLAVNAAQTIIGGGPGTGQMIVSNGTWLGQGFVVGGSGRGTLTVAGGTSTMGNPCFVGETSGTGTLWLTGGLLDASGQEVDVGIFHGIGQMTVSNGTFLSRYLLAGTALGDGTITIAGGTNSVTTLLSLGTPDCLATGVVTIVGGNLFVTNVTGNAILDVESGTFTLNSGTIVVDTFVLTNVCSHFVRTGGTLIYNSAVLSPDADTDGDGIPNGYEQSHGLDPLDAADVAMDPDGDGMSNLQEYLAGTDPTNNASYLHITGIVRTNNNLLISWIMGPGKTNALQSTSGASDGSYATNSFTNLFIVTNTVGSATNYLDVGGATNSPSRFYRVRLVP